MSTLHVHDVPPAVAQTLKERAAREGKSLSAYVAAELTRLASRPTNAELTARLADRDRTRGPDTGDTLKALEDGRR